MNIEEEIFKKCKIDKKKLSEYGFKKIDNGYIFNKNILDDTFRIEVMVDENNNIQGKVFEIALDEEYTNFRVNNMTGEFVGLIKSEFIKLLTDIKDNCTVPFPFISKQANRIAKLIKDKYGDEPSFKWDKFPGYAIFKNKDMDKWYGIIMNLDINKLDKDSFGEVEIIDIKLDKEKIPELLKRKGFYPAYHMNKVSWITIILNDTISDKELMDLICESYFYSTMKK